MLFHLIFINTQLLGDCLSKELFFSKQMNTSEKLPSPDTLFSSVTKPDFLSSHLTSHKVNWDDITKNINDTTDLQTNGNYTSVPPPADEVDPRSEISSEPVKYVITESSVDPKLLTVSSNTGDTEHVRAGQKRGQDTPSTSITKKPKGELFREKEKRKRDLGMSSRGKNFVEEEKRVLREQFEKK